MAEIITLSERMVKLETQLDNIAKTQEDIQDSIKSIQTSIQTMTIQNDLRYADKRTENTVDAAVWIIVSAVILAILALVFKKKQ